jgi:ADP-ribose pyrophosphatase
MFLAKGGRKTSEQELDDTEDMEVLVLSVDEVKELLRQNKIVQSLHSTCMFYALEKLGHLRY